MLDFAQARRNMVDCQIRPADVTDHLVMDALAAVHRERFLPEPSQHSAYSDGDLVLDGGAVVLAPRTFAKMLQAAGIGPDDVVLDIGCALGYSAAVLARLAGIVVALESDPTMVERATVALADAGVENCAVLERPLPAGDAEHGPYDVIFIEGGIECLPPALPRQLRDGGRLLAVMRESAGGECRRILRAAEAFSEISLFDATAPLCPGFGVQPGFTF